MAEERIDIKVTDSGSDKAAKGLRAIASEAVKAQRAVVQVSANLSKLPVSQLNALANMANKAAIAAAKMATEEQRAARAMEMTRREAERTAQQVYRTAQAKMALEREELRLAAARDKAAASAAKETAATNATTTATNLNAAANVRATKNSKAMTQATLNLSRQFADIGVTAAMGMNPLMILIQQGPQIADAFQMAKTQGLGFTQILRNMIGMAAPFLAFAAVFGVMAARFAEFKNEVEDDQGIKEYVKTLGLTKDELKELENAHVTFGDMALGIWDTFNEALNLTETFNKLKNAFNETISFIWNVFKGFTFGLLTAVSGTYDAVISIWNNLPAAFSDLFTQAVNKSIEGLQWLANKSIDVLNRLGGNFEHITLNRMENANAGAAARMGKAVIDSYGGAFNEIRSNYDAAVDYVSKRAGQRARTRIGGQAADIIADRSGGRTRTGRSGASEEEKREEALRRVNAQLDGEISRMGMLKREREAAQRFDQIEEQLLRQRIVLTDEETSSIKEKIAQVQRLAEVQSAMDNIYEELNGATERYTITMDALDQMLDKGTIAYEDYVKQVNKAKNAHTEALDPLIKMGMAQDALYFSLGKYGDELQQYNYYEQIRQTLLKEGIVLSPQYVEGEDAKTDALMKGNAELQRRLALQAAINNTTAPYIPSSGNESGTYGDIMLNSEAMYEELEAQRAEGLLSEKNYNEQLKALDKALYNARLGFASDFFGNLASLTSTGNRELVAIGKAAAVTQATIDGYLAIQKTLAAYPAPWNYAMAASVAVKTGAQIAGIMSTNVGNFATGGQIMVGGRDGVDKNNINMNVTKGERVTIETPAQQKATDAAIANGQAGGGGGDVKITSVNVVDPRFVIDSMDTAAGGKVIMNYITSNPQQINAVLGRR